MTTKFIDDCSDLKIHGSEKPSIGFCLEIKKDFGLEKVHQVMSFIRTFQKRSPIFFDDLGEKHKMTCETIIRTDIPRSQWRNWFSDDPNKANGIDDLFVFEDMKAPLYSRSPIQITNTYGFNDISSPSELSWAVAGMLKDNKLDLQFHEWSIGMNIDYDTKQKFGMLELQTMINTAANTAANTKTISIVYNN